MRRFSYSIPVCNRCGAIAQRKRYPWDWRLSPWGGLTCPNCGDPFVPRPEKNPAMHRLFLKFRKYPVLFALIPLFGLLVAALLMGIIPADWSHINRTGVVVGFVMGLGIGLCYSLLLFWFLLKLLRGQWTAFCDLMLEKYLDE